MHAICLAHFERDRAAGGDLYAKFAKCYLQLAGVTPKPKEGVTEVSCGPKLVTPIQLICALLVLYACTPDV